MFHNPIKVKKVSDNIYAYLYPNGVININGIKYQGYSMTAAIKIFKKKSKRNKVMELQLTNKGKQAMAATNSLVVFGNMGGCDVAFRSGTNDTIAHIYDDCTFKVFGEITKHEREAVVSHTIDKFETKHPELEVYRNVNDVKRAVLAGKEVFCDTFDHKCIYVDSIEEFYIVSQSNGHKVGLAGEGEYADLKNYTFSFSKK